MTKLFFKAIVRFIRDFGSSLLDVFRIILTACRRPYLRYKIGKFPQPYKLHLACGDNHFPGWINVDSRSLGSVDFVWDFRLGIPFPDNSASLLYCEHFLEHLPVADGVAFLKECHRILIPGGVIRIAIPSLDVVLERIEAGKWRKQDWLQWPEYRFIQTKCEMLNVFFRWWGHKWIYDNEELCRRLNEAGFLNVTNREWDASKIKEYSGLETRKDSLLIVEASK